MATSKLQRRAVKEIDRIFGCHNVQENLRPDWLVGPNGCRLELDIYIPSIKTAVEVQGAQHYRFNEHFHGNAEGFNQRIQADSQKRILCKQRGIQLHEVASDSDLDELLVLLRGKKPPPDPRHFESLRRAEYDRNEEQIRWLTREYRQKLKFAEAEYEKQKALWIRVPREQRNFETERDFLKAESRVFKRRDQLRRAEERARRGEWRGSNYIVSMGRCAV